MPAKKHTKKNETDKQRLAMEIIAMIRAQVKEMNEEDPDSDPWSEQEEGVGWIDNEVGMATEFLETAVPPEIEQYPVWSELSSVAECKRELEKLSVPSLEFIKYFIENGGSDTFYDERENGNAKHIVEEWMKTNYPA